MINLGNIQNIDGTAIEPVDVITGGSPCQDLSIAGGRAGLAGDRSGLFLEQLRVIMEMRAATGNRCPRYMIWENVPGALNSNSGKDFLEVLNGCIRIVEPKAPAVPMPKDGKWPGSGLLYDDLGRWSLAWRIHDAQFWGVPQRRRRIALVVDFRGRSTPEVLFEQQGLSGNLNQGNAQRKRVACATFGSIAEPNQVWDARGNGNGRVCATITGDHESRITDYTNIVLGLNADARESGMGVLRNCSHAVKTTTREAVCIGNGQANQGALIERAHTLNCMHDPMAILEPCAYQYRVRRLTPLECERLQGYPDGWTDIGDWSDSVGKRHKATDAPRYRALGNSLALPFWRWLLNRIYDRLTEDNHVPTLGSLFDGIGGFPLAWAGKTVWTSEIDEFCIAVVDYHARRNEL